MPIVQPTIVELTEKVDCRYTLVVEASKRARQLVDGAIGVVVGALFVRFAAKFPEKKVVLDYWLKTKYPTFRAELAKAKSGYVSSVVDFDAIAPMPVAAE